MVTHIGHTWNYPENSADWAMRLEVTGRMSLMSPASKREAMFTMRV